VSVAADPQNMRGMSQRQTKQSLAAPSVADDLLPLNAPGFG
jgi:hypothetical protein